MVDTQKVTDIGKMADTKMSEAQSVGTSKMADTKIPETQNAWHKN
jgi:hypothetical protein